MNKILTNVLFMIIAVVIIVVLGNLFFISTLDNKILQIESDIVDQRAKVESQKHEIETLSSEKADSNAPRVLSIGEEGQVMKHFLDSEDYESPLFINTFDLFASYYYKPESADENTNIDINVNEDDYSPSKSYNSYQFSNSFNNNSINNRNLNSQKENKKDSKYYYSFENNNPQIIKESYLVKRLN